MDVAIDHRTGLCARMRRTSGGGSILDTDLVASKTNQPNAFGNIFFLYDS